MRLQVRPWHHTEMQKILCKAVLLHSRRLPVKLEKSGLGSGGGSGASSLVRIYQTITPGPLYILSMTLQNSENSVYAFQTCLTPILDLHTPRCRPAITQQPLNNYSSISYTHILQQEIRKSENITRPTNRNEHANRTSAKGQD